MEKSHELVLSDVKPMETRHPFLKADVSKPEEVFAVCEGAEAIINLSVLRQHLDPCFDVNVAGTFNMLRAALRFGIKRVVQSGPAPYWGGYGGDCRDDFGLSEEVPARPGTGLYSLTKYLAEETCRAFALQHNLSVVCIRLVGVLKTRTATPDVFSGVGAHLEDIAQAFRLAVEVQDLPSPFEIFHIFCDCPTGRSTNSKARRLLGFRPKINYEEAWRRS
jgi:nucleoside-diphosphate-sugar epimerase